MSIESLVPTNRIDQPTYIRESVSRVALDDIDPSSVYYARIITDPVGRRHFAHDYLAKVDDIDYPAKRSRFLNNYGRIKLSIFGASTCSNGDKPLTRSEVNRPIHEDGMIFRSPALVKPARPMPEFENIEDINPLITPHLGELRPVYMRIIPICRIEDGYLLPKPDTPDTVPEDWLRTPIKTDSSVITPVVGIQTKP